jgi:hypothetical protein
VNGSTIDRLCVACLPLYRTRGGSVSTDTPPRSPMLRPATSNLWQNTASSWGRLVGATRKRGRNLVPSIASSLLASGNGRICPGLGRWETLHPSRLVLVHHIGGEDPIPVTFREDTIADRSSGQLAHANAATAIAYSPS